MSEALSRKTILPWEGEADFFPGEEFYSLQPFELIASENVVSIGPMKRVIPTPDFAKIFRPTPDIEGEKCPTPGIQNLPGHSTPNFRKTEKMWIYQNEIHTSILMWY